MEICNTSLPGQMNVKSGRKEKKVSSFCSAVLLVTELLRRVKSLFHFVWCRILFNFVLVKMFNHRIVRSHSTLPYVDTVYMCFD